MQKQTELAPAKVRLSDELGLVPERTAFETCLNPGRHAGNVSPWVEPGRYEKETHQLAWLAWRARPKRVLADVEQRLRNWRKRTVNPSGDRLALDDFMSEDEIDDLIDYVCDEWL